MLTHSTTYVKLDIFTYRQWVCWVYDGKKKVPIDAKTGKKAKPNDSSTWATYHQAITARDEHNFDGIGFMFSEHDQVCGVDIDNCIDPDTGEVAQRAEEIVDALDTYTEISPSGTGLKAWCFGSKPGTRCKAKLGSGAIEMYDRDRFFTFTNRVYHDKPIRDAQTALTALYNQIFPPANQPTTPISTQHRATSCASLDDKMLLDKARKNPKFRRLYDQGYWTGYKSQSEADMALCGMLAFWCGCDEDQMVRLYMGSRLASHLDRKSDPDSYVERTVLRAIKNCNNTHDPNYKKVVAQDVQEILQGVERASIADPWKGRGAATDRDVLAGIINTGFVHGKLVKGGVSVAVSERDLEKLCGVGSRNTIRRSLRRLEAREWIQKLEAAADSSAAVYLIKGCANLTHNKPCKYYGAPLRTTRRIRNPSQMASTIGKRSGQILDYVHAKGGGSLWRRSPSTSEYVSVTLRGATSLLYLNLDCLKKARMDTEHPTI